MNIPTNQVREPRIRDRVRRELQLEHCSNFGLFANLVREHFFPWKFVMIIANNKDLSSPVYYFPLKCYAVTFISK